MLKDNKNQSYRAQAATELAIFGAILIFVLGIIIRSAMNANYQQEIPIRAMRSAMQASFRSGQAQYGDSSRNSASVLYIEDRRDVDMTSAGSEGGGRFGTGGRIPYAASGSGSFTKNLFMPPEYGKTQELPVMDLFVNGEHFTFTLAGYKTYCLLPGETEAACEPESDWVNPEKPNELGIKWAWDDTCELDKSIPGHPGCAKVYTKITNVPTEGRWSNDLSRFDYNHSGEPDREEPNNVSQATSFSWQWYPVDATTSAIKIAEGSSATYDVDGDLKEEQVLEVVDTGNNEYKLRNPQEGLSQAMQMCEQGTLNIAYMRVIDSQEGDIDLTFDSYDAVGGFTPKTGVRNPLPLQPGLRDNSKIFTQTKDGTYLLLEEGKLYNGRQFVRNVSRQDRVDMVERSIQLSKDTGRMCDGSNPVDVCCNAADCCEDRTGPEPNANKTCFDKTAKILYIRSAISGSGGRKWITDVDE